MKSNSRTLSKSDFKIARDCPTKLYYKKKGYPNNNEENEYMMYLAEGGYMVGKYAQLLYPEGIEVKTDNGTGYALAETEELLSKHKEITLFEAAIEHEGKIIRIDILKKSGDHFDLIEVKSKSWDSSEEDWERESMEEEYYEDVAFQYHVLSQKFPNAKITPYLLMPDKYKSSGIEGLAGWFKIIREEPDPESTFRKVDAQFIPGEGSAEHKQLIQDNITVLVNVTNEVLSRQEMVVDYSKTLIESLKGKELKKINGVLDKGCFKCEFRSEDKTKSGYHECMGKRADPDPHIADLYYIGAIGRNQHANDLISEGKTSLYDIQEQALLLANGKWGARGIRQKLQIDQTKQNKEWFSANLKGELKTWKYPLYFIDFEASLGAIPFHKDVRPYETIAFQWSCHIVDAPNKQPRHFEWINTSAAFPNFEFAKSLMELVKKNGEGTLLMWSNYENTTLRKVYGQMQERGHKDPALKAWLEEVVKMEVNGTPKGSFPGKFVDMNDTTLKHYFHPYMKGRTSIKKTLPAIWNHHPYLHGLAWFKKYHLVKDGKVQNPYETLGNGISDSEKQDVVKEGTAAMRAYFEMIFGRGRSDATARDAIRDSLLRYCELDTMAMVIIWNHWLEKAN